MSKKRLYKITFLNNGNTYELYARECTQGNLFAFIEIGDFVFNNRSSVVVDPSEEKLKSEFANVRRTYIPLQSVIRIDEVDKLGDARIIEGTGKANIHPFPIIPDKKQ